MILTKEELEYLIAELAKEGKIFLCEAQFQFDLAWKIREFLKRLKAKLVFF